MQIRHFYFDSIDALLFIDKSTKTWSQWCKKTFLKIMGLDSEQYKFLPISWLLAPDPYCLNAYAIQIQIH